MFSRCLDGFYEKLKLVNQIISEPAQATLRFWFKMFSKIRNVFESKQSPLKSPHQQEGESVGRGKLEEDGFVVVGQTADERTTVRPGDARNNEPAPDYQVFILLNISSSGPAFIQMPLVLKLGSPDSQKRELFLDFFVDSPFTQFSY